MDPLPPVDKEGFLCDLDDWSDAVAIQLARNAGVTLNDDHWMILREVRDFYFEYRLFPANRILVSRMKPLLGEDKASSIYLMQLFTGKPRRFIAMIAGLPKPSNCD